MNENNQEGKQKRGAVKHFRTSDPIDSRPRKEQIIERWAFGPLLGSLS